MKSIKIILLQVVLILCTLNLSKAQIELPQWQIPMYFEDATGQKDTVWLGYDPEAGLYGENIDPQFGEKWEWIDTSKFNVYFFYRYIPETYTAYLDTVLKKDISSWPFLISSQLYFTHGLLPITIKWDEEALNSPNLPGFYPDISPRPKARIDLMFTNPPIALVDCDICADCYPDIILTSYTNVTFPTCFCAISDSLVINSPPNGEYEISDIVYELHSYLIVPHDYDYFDNIEEDREIGVFMYPNPVKDILYIEKNNTNVISISIYDMQGNLVLLHNYSDNSISIDFTSFNIGIYFVILNDNNKHHLFKIIKI